MKTTKTELISQRLKEARNATGKTQKQVGKTLNISRGTISGYETGQRMPSVDMICSFAQYYNTEVGYLLGMDTSTPSSNMSELKYLIKGRFLDISDLPDSAKKELMNYHDFLKKRELEKTK